MSDIEDMEITLRTSPPETVWHARLRIAECHNRVGYDGTLCPKCLERVAAISELENAAKP